MGRLETWMFARVPRHRRPRRSPPRRARPPSLWRKRLLEDRVQLPRFWPVIQNMVIQELRVRYQRSILGFFWTLLNPLLMMAILSWVFSDLFRRDRELSAVPVRGHGPLGFSERQRERVCHVHHRERGVDPEDLRSQAGLPAGSSLDQPGDVPACRWALCSCCSGRWVRGPRCRCFSCPRRFSCSWLSLWGSA